MNAQFPDARILIVDDSEMNRALFQNQLELGGYTNVELVATGADALNVIAMRPPDIVLMDVRMPQMSGYEVTERIRTNFPLQFIPVILVSALTNPDERVKGLHAGANDFLSKPYHPAELVARIESLLSLKHMRDQISAERNRLALLYSFSHAVTSRLDIQALLKEVVSQAPQLTGAEKAILILIDERGNFLSKIQARYGEPPRTADTIDPTVISEGLLGWVIRRRRPALVADVVQDERWVQLPDEETPSTGSAVAVPLMRGARLLGALLLVSSRVAYFNDEYLELMTAIADQAAVVLENAYLFEETRQQRARTDALLTQTADGVLVTDEEGLITRINPAAREMFGLDDEALQRPFAEALDLTVSDLLIRTKERNASSSGEVSIQHAETGEHRTLNVSISPVKDVGYMLVAQDITALKELEQVRLEQERAEKQRFVQAFSRYMGSSLAERVVSDPTILDRRERREALVLFADLRGFTRLTVEHPAEDVIELLNDMFSEMLDVIYANEGVVFDIVGDELMVSFNVPYEQPDAAQRALKTAIVMQKRFAIRKQKWAKRGMTVGLGIGINRGQVVIGNVGGEERMNYAMVGETVNIAHRLVDMAEDRQIVVSPEVAAEGIPLREEVKVTELPPTRVKGKDVPQAFVLLELDE